MYCAHCGTPLEPGMRFCPGCGAARGDRPRPPWEAAGAPDPAGGRDPDDEDRPDIHVHVHTYPPPPPQPVRLASSPRRAAPLPVNVPDQGKSYVVWAWLALILYAFGYFPGLLANLWLWRQSVGFQRDTGVRAKGSGCLVWLLWVVGVGFPLLYVIGISSGG